ncbi:MAG: DUF2069 domain-containing protein [Thiohalomonadaceae bacterium]
MTSARWHALTLAGYFGLFILLMAWIAWIAPPATVPRSIALLFAVGPLLFPLRGLLHGRPYTHAWSSFLALFYFAYGTAEAFSGSSVQLLAAAAGLLSLLWFISAILFVRTRRKEEKD